MLRFVTLSLVLLSAAAFAADNSADKSAQSGIPDLLVQKTPKTTAVIKLHHVEPALMAFWLDPKNHPAPTNDCLGMFSGRQVPARDGVGTLSGQPAVAKLQPLFESPQGIEELVVMSEQRSLRVRGSVEAIEELKQIIQFADAPLKSVQLDAILYQLSSETLEKLSPADKPANKLANTQSRGLFLRNADQKIIDAAIAEGVAKTLAMPKLITRNNETACIESAKADGEASGEASQTFDLSLVPTVNGDGTLTVLAQLFVRQSKSAGKDAVPAETTQTIQTIFIVRDGDTVGITLPAKDKQQSYLCLITPRLIKEKVEAPAK